VIRGVIFDLDGVLVTTDELHYRAWKRIADEEGVYFDHGVNLRLRGVSRMDSLEILLERASRAYTDTEKLALAERKNTRYRKLLRRLIPSAVLTEARELVAELRRRGIKTAIASSSKNTPLILERVGLAGEFDTVADGNDIRRSKPHPEVFLLAAGRIGVAPGQCLVVEDAAAGIEAGRRAGVEVFGIGTCETLPGVEHLAPNLADVSADDLLIVANG